MASSRVAPDCRDEIHVKEQSVLAFVARSFRSVWPLELLLVLMQDPQAPWQVDALAREVRANPSVVVQGLVALEAASFVATDAEERYRFHPDNPEAAEMAHAVVDLYNQKPRAVMRAIFSAPSDRIQTFADAFRLRKKKD